MDVGALVDGIIAGAVFTGMRENFDAWTNEGVQPGHDLLGGTNPEYVRNGTSRSAMTIWCKLEVDRGLWSGLRSVSVGIAPHQMVTSKIKSFRTSPLLSYYCA